MAHYKRLRCHDCSGVFKHLFTMSDESDEPNRCPLCDAWLSPDMPPEQVFVPQAPAVRSGIARAVDDVYRGTEKSSTLRAEMMAQLGGGSASDYAHTKITNLRDNQKEGDTAYVAPPPNPVSQAIAAQPGLAGHQASAQAFAEANRYGVGAYAGENARRAVTSQHHQQVAAVVNAGRIATYKP